MLKGRYISLLTIFSLVSLVGTGFSSWVVTGASYSTITGNIEVSELIDTKNYFELNQYFGNNHSGISNFMYNSYGFVNDGQCEYNTTMTYYIIFKGKEFSDICNGKYNNLCISFKLSHDSNLSLLQTSYVSVSCKYIIGGNVSNVATTSCNLTTTVENYQVNSVSDKLLLSSFTAEKPYMAMELTYNFNVSNSSNYQPIYEELKNNTSSQFKLTINTAGDNQ